MSMTSAFRRTRTAGLVAVALGGLAACVPGTAHAALPTGNLLKNPGAEIGPTADTFEAPLDLKGWVTEAPLRLRAVEYQTNDSDEYYRPEHPPAGSGCRYFVGPSSPKDADDGDGTNLRADYQAHQDVALPTEAVGKTLRLSADFGRFGNDVFYSDDYGHVDLYFLDAAGNETGSAALSVGDGPGPVKTRWISDAGDVVVPAGATGVRVYVFSVAASEFGAGRGPSHGAVDNVALTFDDTTPARQEPGCQAPVVTTGAPTEITAGSVKLNGTVDTRSEESVRAFFRYGKKSSGTFSFTTAEVDVAPSDAGPSAVSGTADVLLEAGEVYVYKLIVTSDRKLDESGQRVPIEGGVREFTVPGAVKTPVPTASPQPTPRPQVDGTLDPKKAILWTLPRCIKKGARIKIRYVDHKLKSRKLMSIFIKIGPETKQKVVRSLSSKPTETVTITKFPNPPGKPLGGYKAPFRISVTGRWAPLPGFPETENEAVRFATLKYCKPPAKKKRRK